MGHVIKDFSFAEDPWRYPSDEGPIDSGDVVVPLERWLQNTDELVRHRGRVGVVLQTDDDVRSLAATLDYLELVVIEVPRIGDGRCYSMARLLRERLDYGGELRARGAFLVDQMQFMQRCGFDAFEPGGIVDIAAALKALRTFSVFYQLAADGVAPVSELRSRDRLVALRRPQTLDMPPRPELRPPAPAADSRPSVLG